jgi:hypothetical protein
MEQFSWTNHSSEETDWPESLFWLIRYTTDKTNEGVAKWPIMEYFVLASGELSLKPMLQTKIKWMKQHNGVDQGIHQSNGTLLMNGSRQWMRQTDPDLWFDWYVT